MDTAAFSEILRSREHRDPNCLTFPQNLFRVSSQENFCCLPSPKVPPQLMENLHSSPLIKIQTAKSLLIPICSCSDTCVRVPGVSEVLMKAAGQGIRGHASSSQSNLNEASGSVL